MYLESPAKTSKKNRPDTNAYISCEMAPSTVSIAESDFFIFDLFTSNEVKPTQYLAFF